MIEIVRNISTWLIPRFIVIILQSLIEYIKSESMPLLQYISHILTFDMDISLWEEKDKIGKDIVNRS